MSHVGRSMMNRKYRPAEKMIDGERFILVTTVTQKQAQEANARYYQSRGHKTRMIETKGKEIELWVSFKRYGAIKRSVERERKEFLKKCL